MKLAGPVLAVAVLLVALAAVPGASAVSSCSGLGIDYGVSTTSDENDATPTDIVGPDGKLSLREAVNAANGDGLKSTIDLASGNYKLDVGALEVGDNCQLTLNGAGARTTVIQGDTLLGGPGNDTLVGGGGKNVIKGGPGNDIILARNGKQDSINCGRGTKDVAKVDNQDRVEHCETVKRPKK
jgi:Ca2+-binding RTX toxin-like protein